MAKECGLPPEVGRKAAVPTLAALMTDVMCDLCTSNSTRVGMGVGVHKHAHLCKRRVRPASVTPLAVSGLDSSGGRAGCWKPPGECLLGRVAHPRPPMPPCLDLHLCFQAVFTVF